MAARGEGRTGWIFAAPALGLLAVFFVLPVLASFVLSFTDFDLYAFGDPRTARFVGLSNYVRLFSDPLFWVALRNTGVFVVLGGPLTIAVALAAALLLEAPLARFRPLFRTVYFAPVVTTMVAVATVWRYMFHPRFGLIDAALAYVGVAPIDFLGDPRWAMPSIALLACWKNFGYDMIIFVAALQAVPEQLYEAALLDGAGPLRRFVHVTLPSLGPALLFVLVTTAIGYFQLFAEPYVMTRGGPNNATLSVALYMYQQGFRWWNMGYAAAIAFVLFGVILAVSLAQLLLARRRGA